MSNPRLSRFLQQTILPDERIVRHAEFHWMYTAKAYCVAGLFVAIGFGVQYAMLKTNLGILPQGQAADTGNPTPFEMLAPLIGIVAGGFAFLIRMIKKWTTEIVLTDKRFIYKSGVFSILINKMDVTQINYCNITQSLLGNMFDYGRVYIYTFTLDDKNIYLPAIAGPNDFSSAIEQVKKMQY